MRTLWKVIIGVIIVIGIVLVLFNVMSLTGKAIYNPDKNNNINISSDNFVFLRYSYLNPQYSGVVCNKGSKPDELKLYYRLINFDSVTWVSCNVFDGVNQYPNQHFAQGNDNSLKMSLEKIDYTKSHEMTICCRYDDSITKSNEFCLPKVEIRSLC